MDGHLSDVLNWWLLLRAALDGTTPHRSGAVEFEDRDGGPLDLSRSFVPDDSLDEMGWFLEQAGFRHIKGLYREGEMAAVSAEMDVVATRYADGDGRSWWASLKDCSLGRHSYDCCGLTVGPSSGRRRACSRGSTYPSSTSPPKPEMSPCTARAPCTWLSRP